MRCASLAVVLVLVLACATLSQAFVCATLCSFVLILNSDSPSGSDSDSSDSSDTSDSLLLRLYCDFLFSFREWIFFSRLRIESFRTIRNLDRSTRFRIRGSNINKRFIKIFECGLSAVVICCADS